MPHDKDPATVNGAARAIDGMFLEPLHRRHLTAGQRGQSAADLRRMIRNLQLLLGQAKSGSPLLALQAVGAIRSKLDAIEYEAVALGRSYGWSWRDVGDAMGVRKSSAHRRFGHIDRGPRRPGYGP